MTFNIPDIGTVRISFSRDSYLPGHLETFCHIEYPGQPNEVVLSTGMACLNPGDRPNKEIGRKVALARAMGGDYRSGHWTYRATAVPKPWRTAIWRAYHGRKQQTKAATS